MLELEATRLPNRSLQLEYAFQPLCVLLLDIIHFSLFELTKPDVFRRL